MVNGKGFSIFFGLEKLGTEGVLLSQGGSAAGYVLYQKDQKIWFGVRAGGKLSTVSGMVPETAKNISVRMTSAGAVTGDADGVQIFVTVHGMEIGSAMNC